MHTWWIRLNVVLMQMMVFAIFILVATQVSNLLVFQTPFSHNDIKADIESVRVVRLRSDQQRDRAVLLFEMDLDLTPLFDWNTKQIFVFLEASYPSSRGMNRMIVWDKVIYSREQAKLKLSNNQKQLTKYEMDDVSNGLLDNANVTLRLGWDTMPYAGFVGKHTQLQLYQSAPGKRFAMPGKYGKFT